MIHIMIEYRMKTSAAVCYVTILVDYDRVTSRIQKKLFLLLQLLTSIFNMEDE